MKLLTYGTDITETHAGVINEADGRVIDLTKLLGAESVIKDIGDLIDRYTDPVGLIKNALTSEKRLSDYSFDISEVKLFSPILRPHTARDFAAYPMHVISAGERNGSGTPECWIKAPIYYYQNTNIFCGPEATVYRKPGTKEWDFEAEVAFVIGKKGINIEADDTALDYILGFTIFNDWSDRESCAFELGFLGLHHGKDSASGMGPYIVTTDELKDKIIDGKICLKVDAWINDQHYTDGNTGTMCWTLPEMISYASAGSVLMPGDFMGIGTVGTGCLYEKAGEVPYLSDGDKITITTECLGTLIQHVGCSK